MDAVNALSTLHFGMKIMGAKNIKVTNSKGHLFVRCYLSAGNNRRVRLESQEVSPHGSICWEESFSLDCFVRESMDVIIQGTVIFELRWRSSTTSLLQKIISGNGNVFPSQLLGRGEVSWRSILESPNMETERWVVMLSKKAGIKVPSIFVQMKIEIPQMEVMNEKNTNEFGTLKNKLDESCGCCHGQCSGTSCIASEPFAVGCALDAFYVM